MNAEEALTIVREAREKGEVPSLVGVNLARADLHGVDLRWANLYQADLSRARLSGANLSGASLYEANLYGVDLTDARLSGADLLGADLYGANLRGANLRWANLLGADLSGADLAGANLAGANLSGADLAGANLRGANLFVARGLYLLGETPSGLVFLQAHPGRWLMKVGCWDGTPDELRDLIASDDGWPEAEGDEISRRRPYLEAVLAYAEVFMADHSDDIKESGDE